jgi:hypothetical protein
MRLGKAKQKQATRVELPARSENVILSTKSGGQIPARVVESGENSLLVAITVPTRPLSAEQLEDLVLEFHSARGRIRLHGLFAVDDPSDPDLLRMKEPRSVEVQQQRSYVRIQAARPVVVYGTGSTAQYESFTVDVSGGGLLLAGPDTLEIGEEVMFRVSIKQGQIPISGTGRVVRVDDHGRRAVAFEKISDLDRRRLVRLIFELQRNERHHGVRAED